MAASRSNSMKTLTLILSVFQIRMKTQTHVRAADHALRIPEMYFHAREFRRLELVTMKIRMHFALKLRRLRRMSLTASCMKNAWQS